jgi:hypothetical protein
MNQDTKTTTLAGHRVLYNSLLTEWDRAFDRPYCDQFMSALESSLHDCRRRALAADDLRTVRNCDRLLAEVEWEVRPWLFS